MGSYGRPATAVVDIDGVIATGTKEDVYSHEAGWAYEKCTVIKKGLWLLQELRDRDIHIILHTARWDTDREKTELWLEQNKIPYDELIMAKPSGDIYIDDKGLQFTKHGSIESCLAEVLGAIVISRNKVE